MDIVKNKYKYQIILIFVQQTATWKSQRNNQLWKDEEIRKETTGAVLLYIILLHNFVNITYPTKDRSMLLLCQIIIFYSKCSVSSMGDPVDTPWKFNFYRPV